MERIGFASARQKTMQKLTVDYVKKKTKCTEV